VEFVEPSMEDFKIKPLTIPIFTPRGLLKIINNKTALFPVSHIFQATKSPCHHKATKRIGLRRELPLEAQLSTTKADSQLVNCIRISYQLVIHIPRTVASTKST
jgi:hypothetical protein